MAVVELKIPQASDQTKDECLALLRKATELVESGSVDGVVLILNHVGGSWRDEWAGMDAMPLTRSIGQMEIMKQTWIHRYLKQERGE